MTIRTCKTHAHPKMNVVRRWEVESLHIGTLVVVHKRAVIEEQARVCFIVRKDIMVNEVVARNVVRQKQCLRTHRHQRIFVESVCCENPETSCSESRRKF